MAFWDPKDGLKLLFGIKKDIFLGKVRSQDNGKKKDIWL